MEADRIYGKKNLCKICGIQPAMTETDYSRKYITKTGKMKDSVTKVIIYGSRPTKRQVCFFCDRERRRDEFQETLAEKKAANRSAIGDGR